MPKCYDQHCTNEVHEPLTLCTGCKEVYYPTAKSTVESIQYKLQELAKTAPKRIPYTGFISSPKPPKKPLSKEKLCALCPQSKKNAVTVQLGKTDYYVCWSHKVKLEHTYPQDWQIHAIANCEEHMRLKQSKDQLMM